MYLYLIAQYKETSINTYTKRAATANTNALLRSGNQAAAAT